MGTLTRPFSCLILVGALIGTNIIHLSRKDTIMPICDSEHQYAWQEATSDIDTTIIQYRKKCGVVFGDINVFIGDNIRDNTRSALRKAMQFVEGCSAKVLMLNTSTGQRWALAQARQIDPRRIGDQVKNDIRVMGSVSGDLCKEFHRIVDMIDRHGIRIIIINSWEFASENSRYRERLLFQLRRICEEYGVTVLAYSHQKHVGSRDAGRATHGLAKLSAVAANICSIQSDLTLPPEEEESKYEATNIEVAAAGREEMSGQFVSEQGRIDRADPEPAESALEVVEEEDLVLA
jgi:hypothetical protein